VNEFNSAFTLFLSLLVEAMPFLLLGVLLSGILLIFVDRQKLVALLPKNPVLGALAGSLMGFMLPVCECGNVPVVRQLIVQGAPVSVCIGFLLAAPTINPIVIWATWTAFRDQPEIVVLRVVLSLAIATIIGTVFSVQPNIRPLLQPALIRLMPTSNPNAALLTGTFFLGEPNKPIDLNLAIPKKNNLGAGRWQLLIDNTIQELRELGGVLVIGSAIATIIQVGIPREVILNLGQGAVSSVVAMIILAAIVSICSTVDAFFALSFASLFSSGAILAFLVFGPIFDLKSIGLLMTVFKKQVVIYLFLIAAQLTFIFCLFINLHIEF
jgi:uncharacterized protein